MEKPNTDHSHAYQPGPVLFLHNQKFVIDDQDTYQKDQGGNQISPECQTNCAEAPYFDNLKDEYASCTPENDAVTTRRIPLYLSLRGEGL